MANGRRARVAANLKAWWNGYILPDGGEDRGDATGPGGLGDAGGNGTSPPIEIRAAERAVVMETVWGESLHSPGGWDEIQLMVKPIGLTNEMSVLDLGAHLGGAGRLITKTTDAWVTGYEADPELQEAGMQRSVDAGLEKRAPVIPFDPKAPDFDKRYDAVFSKEWLFGNENRESILTGIKECTKKPGHLVFTDYLLAEGGGNDAALAGWRSREPSVPEPWPVSKMLSVLGSLGFDVRIADDITDKHVHEIVTAWDQVSSALNRQKTDAVTAQLLMDEGDLWLHRVAAMQSGGLRLYRFHALIH